MRKDRYNSADWKKWIGPKLEIPDDVFSQVSWYAIDEGLRKQIEGVAKEVIAKADVFTRTTIRGLTGILEDKRLKNQFETKYSKGNYNPKRRREAELKIMGVPIRRRYTKRPIYGYLSDEGAINSVNHYGEIILKMKTEIRHRTTFTADDSLNGAGCLIASPLDYPDYRSWRYYNRDFVVKMKDAVEKHPQNLTSQYMEIQIHDGVDLFKDVEYLRFPKNGAMYYSSADEKKLGKLKEQAKGMGLKVIEE